MKLYCDNRERQSVLPKMPNLDFIEQHTLAVGDYAIGQDGEIYYVFERKTWKDLAASIKDGRLESQIKKMQTLTCPIFIILEGKFTYDRDRDIAGIPFYKLSAMHRKLLMLGLQVVQTKDVHHTIEFLIEFTKQTEVKTGATQETLTKIKTQVKKTLPELVDDVWMAVPGIGQVLLPSMRNYKLSEFVTFTVAQIQEIKYVSGRRVTAKLAEKIFAAFRDPIASKKILTAFPGFTKDSAQFVLDQISLLDVITTDISNIQKSENRRIGDKLYEQVQKIVNFKN